MHTFSTSADEINNRRQSRHIVLLLFGKSPISFSAKNRICVCFFKKQPRVLKQLSLSINKIFSNNAVGGFFQIDKKGRCFILWGLSSCFPKLRPTKKQPFSSYLCTGFLKTSHSNSLTQFLQTLFVTQKLSPVWHHPSWLIPFPMRL